MMVPPSKEFLKKDKEFWDNVGDWLIYNPETGKNELKSGTPQRLVKLYKWLKDNYPGKSSPFKD